MRQKIIALLCMLLFVSFPFADAAEIVPAAQTDKQDTGASIAVNVKSIEPTILTSNLIEDNNVPIYVYLAGSTLGTLLQSSLNLEPVYGGIQIQKMTVKPLDASTNDYVSGSPSYSQPLKFDAHTLGYLTVNLKQFDPNNFDICDTQSDCKTGYTCETSACYPDELNLNFTSEIWFTKGQRLYTLAKSALILPADANEETWTGKLDQYGAMYSFYGGRGLIRVKDITSDTVDLTVYSNKDLYWPIIGAPRALADLSLRKGQTSEYVDLGYTDAQVLPDSKFTVTLNDIRDPAREHATIAVTVGGARSQVTVAEGTPLYPGSSWTVKSIDKVEGRSGLEYSITIKDAKGNVNTITTKDNGGFSSPENNFLNGKFYTSGSSVQSGTTPYYYSSSTKTINTGSFSGLQTAFRQYNLQVDISKVQDSGSQTNKITLQDGVSLKEVLFSVLPPGYSYSLQSINGKETIVIESYSSEDPCANANTYTDDGVQSLASNGQSLLDNTVKLNMLCTVALEAQRVIDEHDSLSDPATGSSLAEEAYMTLGQTYDAITLIDGISRDQKRGAEEKALAAYKELVQRGSSINSQVSFGDRVQQLQGALTGNLDYGVLSVDDNGQNVYIELLSVQELAKEDSPSAIVTKDGIQTTYFLSDIVSSGEDEHGKFTWYVTSISDSSMSLRKKYSSSSSYSSSVTITEGGENVDGVIFKLKSVNSKKEAYLTITPGTGQALKSSTNFTVHLPIEYRAINLNPDKINDTITKAKELQVKLDKIIEDLTQIVKTWNKVCYGVFAILTLKNAFSATSSGARHDAIHGVDGNSGWAAYCQEQAANRQVASYDLCMEQNAAAIQREIDATQNAQQYAKGLNGNYNQESWYTGLTSGYTDLSTCKKYIGDSAFLTDKSIADYAYLEKLQETLPAGSQMSASVDEKLQGYTQGVTSNQRARIDGCNAATTAVKNHQKDSELAGLSDAQKEHKMQEIASGVYSDAYGASLLAQKNAGVSGLASAAEPEAVGWPSLSGKYLQNVNVTNVGKVFGGKTRGNTGTVYTETSTVAVEVLTVAAYKEILQAQSPVAGTDAAAKITNDLNEFEKDQAYYSQKKQNEETIVSKDGAWYYFAKNGNTYDIYVGSPAYATGELNTEYADDAKLEIYGSGAYKGMPYCLPYKDGNFIKILSYTQVNEPDVMQLWNVGSDGELCTGDDVLVEHQSELAYNTASPSYTTLRNFAAKFIKQDLSGRVTVGSHTFVVSSGRSLSASNDQATASCFDVMDPGDCKLLFNSCDPVMCPSSRFNLGGRYQVADVVQSGVIGSIILPQGSGDTVPVCLTGILASLNFWKSMLDGYVQCLESAKYEGKSVGVCDKISSVYQCELFVREAVALLDNNKDGLLDVLSNGVYGRKDQGGGEYVSGFADISKKTQDSVSYFTSDYPNTAFAAFKGRSLEEVGTTICKQVIYEEGPWFGDFMDQLTTPEDPNQFYATLTVKPYAPSQGTAAYQTYYHIYAGNNPNIQNVPYQVYLKNSQTGEPYYVTGQCGGVSGTLELTEMADQTIDCIAPTGFDTVCVVLSGVTNCGFGSVSTSFADQYIKDSVVTDEVHRNIQSEKDCYPSVSRTSPTLGSIPLPSSTGELSTSIQRVCSLQDPALGQGAKGSWTIVGTCGEDNAGRSLGSCWLNTDSISIEDTKRSAEVTDYLKQVQFAETRKAYGFSGLIEDTESQALFTKYVQQMSDAKDCAGYTSLILSLRDLNQRSVSSSYSEAAQYYIALIYYQIAVDQKLGSAKTSVCGLTGSKGIDYTRVSSSGSCIATGGSDAYENAFLDMIAYGEAKSYNTLFGGGTFDCTQGYPSTSVTAGGLTSSAAGRYQFIQSTYDLLKKNGEFSNGFCETDQDKAALYLVHNRRGVSVNEVQNAYIKGSGSKEWLDVLDKLAPEWASLPMTGGACEANSACKAKGCIEGRGCYDQAANDQATLYSVFENCYAVHSGSRTSTSIASSAGASFSSNSDLTELAPSRDLVVQADEPYIVSVAAAALQSAAQEFYLNEGKAIVVADAARTLREQAQLLYDNCLVNADGKCSVPTCNAASGSSVISGSSNAYTLKGALAGVTDENMIVSTLEANGREEKCSHTSLAAVDLWCDDGGSSYVHDPQCQDRLRQAMIDAGFCRLDSEAWHFEWDASEVEGTKCSIRADATYKRDGVAYDPTANGCTLWDYQANVCVQQ